jgi:hypothetical protein
MEVRHLPFATVDLSGLMCVVDRPVWYTGGLALHRMGYCWAAQQPIGPRKRELALPRHR